MCHFMNCLVLIKDNLILYVLIKEIEEQVLRLEMEVLLPALLGNYDRPAPNQPTEVTLPINLKKDALITKGVRVFVCLYKCV